MDKQLSSFQTTTTTTFSTIYGIMSSTSDDVIPVGRRRRVEASAVIADAVAFAVEVRDAFIAVL